MIARILDRGLSLRQLAHLAVVAAAVLGVPYLAVGLLWSATHGDHLAEAHGADKAFSVVGEVVAWPVLVAADLDLR
ncbi:hypothetical protein ACWEQ0_08520 [Nocardia thailandica]